MKTKSNLLNLNLSHFFQLDVLQMNKKNCVNINFAHEKFLNKKTNPSEKLSYVINELI